MKTPNPKKPISLKPPKKPKKPAPRPLPKNAVPGSDQTLIRFSRPFLIRSAAISAKECLQACIELLDLIVNLADAAASDDCVSRANGRCKNEKTKTSKKG